MNSRFLPGYLTMALSSRPLKMPLFSRENIILETSPRERENSGEESRFLSRSRCRDPPPLPPLLSQLTGARSRDAQRCLSAIVRPVFQLHVRERRPHGIIVLDVGCQRGGPTLLHAGKQRMHNKVKRETMSRVFSVSLSLSYPRDTSHFPSRCLLLLLFKSELLEFFRACG